MLGQLLKTLKNSDTCYLVTGWTESIFTVRRSSRGSKALTDRCAIWSSTVI